MHLIVRNRSQLEHIIYLFVCLFEDSIYRANISLTFAGCNSIAPLSVLCFDHWTLKESVLHYQVPWNFHFLKTLIFQIGKANGCCLDHLRDFLVVLLMKLLLDLEIVLSAQCLLVEFLHLTVSIFRSLCA